MTPAQIQHVQTSWQSIVAQGETIALLFYQRLFEIAPAVRPLFQHDISDQGQKLMAMLDTVVRNLHQAEKILPAVRALGRRHARYGVEPEHYAVVAAALLWALKQGLGDAFDRDTRNAWSAAYNMLAVTMQEAAANTGQVVAV